MSLFPPHPLTSTLPPAQPPFTTQAGIQLQELQARMEKEEKYKADVQVGGALHACTCVHARPHLRTWAPGRPVPQLADRSGAAV